MTTRWDVERAVLADEDLAPIGRLLMLILATYADQQTAVIPPKYSPSLTGLVRASGLARSTVALYLNRLESAGWLVRHRPTPQEARTKHARTRYALKIPKLVRQSHGASPETERELVRPSAKASPPVVHKTNHQPSPTRARENAREEEVIEAIVETLREVAPNAPQAHTREWAERVAETIPGGRDRVRYVATVIRNNPQPFLPTPAPPRFRAPQPT